MNVSTKYTKEFLEPIVQSSTSWAQIVRACNLSLTGGNYRMIQKWVKFHNIDFKHTKGQGWSKGLTKKSDKRVAGIAKKLKKLTHADIMSERANPSVKAHQLREAMISEGIPYQCSVEECKLSDWLGKPITLHIDHINGISNDNRSENVRFLCPNCHQQTPTWGNKKR